MFNAKKTLACLMATIALASAFAVNTFAYSMGGASVGNKGTGAIWNAPNEAHTLYGETDGKSGYNNVGIRVRIAYTDAYGYSRNAYSPSSSSYTTDTDGYVSDSVIISSSATPVTGYGYYKIDDTTNSSSHAWNFGR